MARGTQFLDILTRVKNDTGRSNAVNVGTDDLPRLKEAINTVYSILYLDRDWRHLRKHWTKPLAAGSRYYDLPTGLNHERLEYVKLWDGSMTLPIDYGITDEDYAIYNSDEDARSSQVMKWDVRWVDTREQIEVWPVPNTDTQELRFAGIQAAPRLVNDIDRCLLDDTLIVLATAAYLEKDEEEQKKKDAATARHLGTLLFRDKSAADAGRLGLGHVDERSKRTVILRVS